VLISAPAAVTGRSLKDAEAILDVHYLCLDIQLAGLHRSAT
jgi:hypothetical protein